MGTQRVEHENHKRVEQHTRSQTSSAEGAFTRRERKRERERDKVRTQSRRSAGALMRTRCSRMATALCQTPWTGAREARSSALRAGSGRSSTSAPERRRSKSNRQRQQQQQQQQQQQKQHAIKRKKAMRRAKKAPRRKKSSKIKEGKGQNYVTQLTLLVLRVLRHKSLSRGIFAHRGCSARR